METRRRIFFAKITVADTVAGTGLDGLACAYTVILEAIENTGQYMGN
jgi:hypothetical protein